MNTLMQAKYINDPKKQKFYIGISCEGVHLFERPKRQGYTTDISKAGKFSNLETNEAVKYFESHGYQRWCIPTTIMELITDSSPSTIGSNNE